VQTLKLIVREVRQESPLIRSFRLAREDGGPLPAFGPGAHLKVSVPGLREPRCYSLVQLAPEAGRFAEPSEYRLGVGRGRRPRGRRPEERLSAARIAGRR
jgi:vanillate O-demethylase ferredoxin subunit